MNTVNTALFILVWTFTAVCRADDDINVTCADVTGFVGKEVNLICKVSLQNTDCYIKLYKFRNPKESTICKEEFPKELREQRNNIITCSYTPTTAMTERFSFFVLTTCGQKTTEFTVNIADVISCDDVTGSVGKEVNLTCKVSLPNTDCCIQSYTFQHPNDSMICKPGFFPRSSCEQRNSFTCSYTPTTAMTERFRFFLQTTCAAKTTEFTVNIADTSLRKADEPEDTGSKDTVISSVVCLLVIIILIIILMTFIYKKQYFRFPFLCIKHNEDSNSPENVI